MSLGELTQWATPTGWGLVGVFVLLVATGRLIPVKTVNRELARADKEATDWKETAQLERKAREIQATTDDEILGLLRAMNTPADRRAPAS